ncbi:MAG: ATP-binding protein [bacterium]|nr:ATP-binding protein [bacterium]
MVDRHLQTAVRRVSEQFPVVLVTGARQVGKTTLLRHAASADRRYVSLDDPLLLEQARREPELFLERYPGDLLLDEIQYAPGLLPLIKQRVDADARPGRYWLTGSQPFHLMRGVSESLAGRVAVLQLHGLSAAELDGRPCGPFLPPSALDLGDWRKAPPPLALPELYRRIFLGSFPALALGQVQDRDIFYGSYLQTYLLRDLRDLAQVGDLTAFLRFLKAVAARTAQLLNLSDLARDADVAVNTAKAWLSILESIGLVLLLDSWHSNRTKRLVKAPKLHMLDTGLCAHLAGWSSPETLEAGAMSGPILESWVVGEILRSWRHHGREGRLHHFRDKDQVEVDLLIEQDGQLHPVEVKKSARPVPDDVKAFRRLAALGLPLGPGALVCLCAEAMPLGSGATALPAGGL